MNENECRANNQVECKVNRENKFCILKCGCGRLFALKLRELLKK